MADFDFDEKGHVLYKLRNAKVDLWPFPHFFAQNVFSTEFYEDLLFLLGNDTPFEDSPFQNREFGNTAELKILDFMRESAFLKEIVGIFAKQFEMRYGVRRINMHHDLRVIRDSKGYKIGPHTDTPWKLVSLLFYLPSTAVYREFGTSIYFPKTPGFTCPGGPHHPFEDFNRIYTAPYIPNSCFGFFKTNNSFHGVEPLPVQFNRDVLLYNIYDSDIYSHRNHSQE